MLIGFESGAIVLWDLRSKTADVRFMASEVSNISCLIRFISDQFSPKYSQVKIKLC